MHPADLEGFVARVLAAAGFAQGEAEACAHALVRADAAGVPSHGVARVPEYCAALRRGDLVAGAEIKILSQGPAYVAADAGRALGQVAVPALLEALYAKVAEAGVASGTLRNCGHVGRLADWVEAAALRGHAALMLVQDNGALACVAPPGGVRAVTSTNPIGFACPVAGAQPFVLDMATSATAIGRARLLHQAGEAAPEGTLQDSAGRPTTDPGVLFAEPSGAIRPAGAHKGFGLAMVADLLAAGLSGGHMPPAPAGTPCLNTVCITLWNPAYFAGLSHMAEEAAQYLDHIRACPPIDHTKPVRVPGDRAAAAQARAQRDGVAVAPETWARLERLAARLGVAVP
ncbi:MAG: Ldh family oxidoreductase [Alphaproteobacteria bacterium]|nr:Ldh family oxidoreductase [Alphaproteobacteria bacterium]